MNQQGELSIWVCFKVQPEFDHVLEGDWEGFGPDTDLRYARHAVNCFDESSLEIALRLKESLARNGLRTRLGAITLADALAPSLRKHLFAAGYDEILRIGARLEFLPKETGRLLAAHLAARAPDLVLLGKQAGYADTGTVPYYVAQGLGIPLLAGAENLQWEEGQGLTVTQALGGMRRKLAVRPPLAVAVGNSPVAALRASTLRRQIEVSALRETVIPEEAAPAPAPVLVRNRIPRSVQMLEADAWIDTLRRALSGASGEAAAEQSLCPWPVPPQVLLAHGDDADAALRYAAQNGLPCVNGAVGLSADGKSVIQKACGSYLEWHIPLRDEKQVWVASQAVPMRVKTDKIFQDTHSPAIADVVWEEPIPLNPLPQARLLLAGGRGMGAEGFAKLRRLADLLGGQACVTRAAAQNGWGGMELLVGQSGAVARPEVCLAFGVSGAAAFMAGVEKARLLLAVNTDPDAPIFQYADYGLVADAAKTLDALLDWAERGGCDV